MKFGALLASGVVLAATAFQAEAHVGRAMIIPENMNEVAARHVRHNGRLMARAKPTNAAEMAQTSDAATQCGPYGVAGSDQLSKMYPKAGQVAQIVQGDNDAQQLWQEIQKSGALPKSMKPKAGTDGNMGIDQQAMSSYNTTADTDCWWSATGCTTPRQSKFPADIKDCNEPSTWGLTFDDGPNCSHNAFYDYLKEQKLKATLFYIGTNVIDLPLQAQRGLADGHDVCVHTWSHHYMTTLTNEQVFAELYYTMRIIKDVTGVTTRCWRPPFGDVDDRVRAIAGQLGLRTIIWSDDTNDWDIQPGGSEPTQKIDSNYDKIINKGKNDSSVLVLTHEINNNTMQEFMKEFPKIQQSFKNIVPLTACLNVTNPYVEDNITYPVFNDYVSGKAQPKGLPDMNNMAINPGSKIQITPLNNQTTGSFSPTAMNNTASKAAAAPQSSGASAGAAGASASGSGASGAKNAQAQATSKDAQSSATSRAMATMLAPIMAMCVAALVAFS